MKGIDDGVSEESESSPTEDKISLKKPGQWGDEKITAKLLTNVIKMG